jgi:hypothetical protein
MNYLRRSGRDSILIALSISSLLIAIAGCDDGPYYKPPEQPDNINFDLLVVDQRGTDGSAFPEGTDIKIVLKFITEENKYIEWHKDNECRMFTNKDFFLVFKLDEGNDLPFVYLPVGTPYRYPINCNAADAPSSYLFGSSVIIELNWSANPDNMPLTPGRYYTVANFEANVEGKTQRWELRRDFEIY